MNFLGSVLGIKDPIHKQKIALKAMDVVLFGPPKGKYGNMCIIRVIDVLFNYRSPLKATSVTDMIHVLVRVKYSVFWIRIFNVS